MIAILKEVPFVSGTFNLGNAQLVMGGSATWSSGGVLRYGGAAYATCITPVSKHFGLR